MAKDGSTVQRPLAMFFSEKLQFIKAQIHQSLSAESIQCWFGQPSQKVSKVLAVDASTTSPEQWSRMFLPLGYASDFTEKNPDFLSKIRKDSNLIVPDQVARFPHSSS